jgi:large subunit ribosomal protein L47
MDQVKLTQRAIKHVLTERWYAWEDARLLAEGDASVSLYPAEYEEEAESAQQELAPPNAQTPVMPEQIKAQQETRV